MEALETELKNVSGKYRELMDRYSLIPLLLKQFDSKFASTFFINGPPGSGKAYLLKELASTLPSYMPNTIALGPYNSSFEEMNGRIVDELFELWVSQHTGAAGL